MSKICMTLTSSSGTWLKDCLQPQHYYVSITIDDPDGKVLARVSLSYEQAAKMLLYNGDVECTLDKYRDEQGKLVEEKVTPPETVHQRMKDRLKETHSSLAKRLEDARRDVYEMLNSGKANKTNLTNLLQNIEVIQNHYRSNESFVVQQAEEELGAMQNNAAGQLGLFLQSHGANLDQEELRKMIPSGAPLELSDKSITPIKDDYVLKQRETKSIDKLTALETADAICFQLQKFEKQQQSKSEKEKSQLFGSNASAKQNKVNIRYITYQGTSTLSLEQARDYLRFLLTIKDIKEFKTHYWFKGDKNDS